MAINHRKVHGCLNSPATLKVLACLFEHHLDFEFVPIYTDIGDHMNKPFLAISPFGQVPVFHDGDIKQFESRAIIRSTAHQYGKKGEELIYWDARAQALVSNWIDVEDHHFEPPALILINELVTKPKKGLPPDDSAVAEAEARLDKVLDVYEARLTKFKYLASDKYTIADLVHLPNLHALWETKKGKELIQSRAHVGAWCCEILARPAWAKVLEMLQQTQVFNETVLD